MDSSTLELFCVFLKKVVSKDDNKCVLNVIKVMTKTYLCFEESNPACQKIIVQNLSYFADLLTDVNKNPVSKQWKSFVVNILKKHYTEPEYLDALRTLAEKFYTLSGNFEEDAGVSLKDIHDMLVGHSKFLQLFQFYYQFSIQEV